MWIVMEQTFARRWKMSSADWQKGRVKGRNRRAGRRAGIGNAEVSPVHCPQASALTATELTNSTKPGFWSPDKWGTWWKWAAMGENGGEWGGGEAGVAHRMWVVEGCGGMWLRRMGSKWDELPIFHNPTFPISPEVEDLSHSSLCKKQLSALTDRKMGFCATHRHSPPVR